MTDIAPADIQFEVNGTPAPGGSKKVFSIRRQGFHTGRFIVTDDAKHNKEWRAVVAAAARAAKLPMLDGPIFLSVVFYMPRPKSHFWGINRIRTVASLRADAPYYHTTKPDATKLLRSTEDALTGILWKDDAQIVIQVVQKLYVPTSREQPGASIQVQTRPQHPCPK